MFAPPRRDEVTGRIKAAKRSDTRHSHALPEYDPRHKVDHSGTKNLDSSDFARRNRSKNAKVNNVLQSLTGSRALAEKNKPKFDAQKRNKAALKAAAKRNQIDQVRQEEPKRTKTKKTGRVPETHRGQRPGQRPSKMPKESAPTIHETNAEEMYAIKKGPQGYGLGDRITPHTTAYQDVGHAAVEPTLSREAQWRTDVQAQIEAKRMEQRKFVAAVSDEEIALAEIAQERHYQRSQQLEALQRSQALPPLHTHTHQPAAEIFPLGFSQPQPVHINKPFSQPQPQHQLQLSVEEPALTAQEQWKRDLDAQIAEKKARKQREKEAEAAQDSMYASSNWALGGMGRASNQEIRKASMSPQTQPNQLRQSPNRLGLSGSQGMMSQVDDAAKFAPRPPMQQSFDRSSGLAELTAARRAILLQQQELEAQIAEKKLRMLKEKEAEALEQMQWLAEAGAISMGAEPKMPPNNAAVGDSSSIAMSLANANMDPDDLVKSGTLSPIHASPSRQHELNATQARSGSISLGGATGRTPTSSAKVKQQDSHKEFLRQQMEEAVAAKKRKAEEARLADLADDERAKREAAELAAQFERDQMKAAEDKQRKLDEENKLREARLAAAAEAEEARTQKIRRHSQATVPTVDDQEDNSKNENENENENENSKKTPKPPSRKPSNIPRYKGARATYTVQEMEKVQEKYNATEEEQRIKQKKGGKGKASGRPKYRPTETVEEEPEEPKKIRRLHDNDTSNPPRGRSPKRSSRRQTQRQNDLSPAKSSQNDGSPAKSTLSSSLLSPGKAATPRATTPRSRGASPSPRVQRIRQDVDGATLAQLSKIKMLLRTQRDIAASAVQQNDVILHNRSRVMNSGRFEDSW